MVMINPDGYYTGHVRRPDKDEIIRQKAEEAERRRKVEEAEEFLRMNRYGVNNVKKEPKDSNDDIGRPSLIALGLVVAIVALGFLVTFAVVNTLE